EGHLLAYPFRALSRYRALRKAVPQADLKLRAVQARHIRVAHFEVPTFRGGFVSRLCRTERRSREDELQLLHLRQLALQCLERVDRERARCNSELGTRR